MQSAGIFHSKVMDSYLLRDVSQTTPGFILKWVSILGKIPAVWIPFLKVNSGAPLHYKGSIPAVWIPLPEVNSGAPLHYKGFIPAVWIPLPEVNCGPPLHYTGSILQKCKKVQKWSDFTLKSLILTKMRNNTWSQLFWHEFNNALIIMRGYTKWIFLH